MFGWTFNEIYNLKYSPIRDTYQPQYILLSLNDTEPAAYIPGLSDFDRVEIILKDLRNKHNWSIIGDFLRHYSQNLTSAVALDVRYQEAYVLDSTDSAKRPR